MMEPDSRCRTHRSIFSMPATPSHPNRHDEGLPVSAPIALTDLLALQVSIEWAEAVAVVEELCSALGDVSGSAVGIPDLSGIAITARGGVILHRGVDPLQDLEGLGRTLHALLDPADTPMALRLFVAQPSGSDKYSSVGAYAAALAYFGRPDRTDIIRALYQRCLTTHAPVAVAPVTPPALVERRPSPQAVRRRVPRWVAIAVSALLCGGGAAVAFWFWRQEARAAAPVAALRKVVDAAVDAAVAAVQNLASSPPPATVEPESPAEVNRPARQRAAVPVPPVADVIVNATPLLTLPFVDQPATGTVFEGGAISPSATGGSIASQDQTVYRTLPTMCSRRCCSLRSCRRFRQRRPRIRARIPWSCSSMKRDWYSTPEWCLVRYACRT